jgi:phosphate transport system substrate-binding protein
MQNRLAYGRVRNSSGNFVKASVGTVTAAAAACAARIPGDFRVSIATAHGNDSYPISSFTWLLVPEEVVDPATKRAITGYLRWILSDGQKMPEAIGYASLPHDLQARELAAIAKIR